MSVEWVAVIVSVSAIIVSITIAVVGWVLPAITKKYQKRELEKERLRKARPRFEDRSIKDPLKGEADDRRMGIVNKGGTATAIMIDDNEFISTETKRVFSGSTLTVEVNKKLFKRADFLGKKQSARINYEDEYGNQYTETIVFFYERPEGVHYMTFRFEECEDNTK